MNDRGSFALEVEDLSVRTEGGRGPEITGDVSFRLSRGGSLAIVGESGSGKSLTARAVMGLLPGGLGGRGRVTVHGTRTDADPRRSEPFRGRTMALLMQDPFTMLHPLRRIGAQLGDGLDRSDRGSRTERRAIIAARLGEVGLDAEVADLLPHELSGGMRQRVGLAAALLGDPSILIADEPTTALDATTQRDVVRLLLGLQRDRGLALVMITHDLGLAFSTCREVLVMYAGGPVEMATAAQLRSRPRHPYTAALIDAEPVIDHRLASLGGVPGSVPSRSDVAGTCAFADRCEYRQHACTTTRPRLGSLHGEPRDHVVACIRARELDLTRRAPTVIVDPVVPPSDDVPVLEVRDLTKTFPGATTRALDAVSLRIGRGESLAVVGESGSGKTTLARIIVGLESTDSGTVVLGGTDVTDWGALDRTTRHVARRRVQMVFQDPYSSLDPRRTVAATLREALRAFDRPAAEADVHALLDRVHLPVSLAPVRPRSLSGGERQRVAIGRALAAEPELLVFDEAVSALDVSVQAQILTLLNELRTNDEMAVLLITHDLAVARQTTESMLVLRAGQQIETGPTHQVLASPTATYTERLLASVPEPSGDWLGDRGDETPATDLRRRSG